MRNLADLTHLSISEVSRVLQRREASVVEVVEACVRQMIVWEPVIHSLVGDLHPRAHDLASESDARYRYGEQLGPLDGVPAVVKGVIDVAGLPTMAGTQGFHSWPARDSSVVRSLKHAGAIPLRRRMPRLGVWTRHASNLPSLER